MMVMMMNGQGDWDTCPPAGQLTIINVDDDDDDGQDEDHDDNDDSDDVDWADQF